MIVYKWYKLAFSKFNFAVFISDLTLYDTTSGVSFTVIFETPHSLKYSNFGKDAFC